MNRLSDRRREVAVRFVRTGEFLDAGLAARAAALLSPAERARRERIRLPTARREYLAGHVLARTMAAGRVERDAAEVSLAATRTGQPVLLAPLEARPLHVSLSHAFGVALCALSANGPVGADVESVANLGTDTLVVACTICGAEEMREVLALGAARRRRWVALVWTLK